MAIPKKLSNERIHAGPGKYQLMRSVVGGTTLSMWLVMTLIMIENLIDAEVSRSGERKEAFFLAAAQLNSYKACLEYDAGLEMSTMTTTNYDHLPSNSEHVQMECPLKSKEFLTTISNLLKEAYDTQVEIERLSNESQKLISKINMLKEEKAELTSLALAKENDLARCLALYSKALSANNTSKLNLDIDIKEDLDSVRKLVENGADINGRNLLGETLIIMAARRPDKNASLPILKYLIEKGANVYEMDQLKRTFLHVLVEDGTNLTPSQFHDLSEYLISKNMSNLFNIPGWQSKVTPFVAAVKNIEVQTSTLTLLDKSGVDFSVVNHLGNSILAFAIGGQRSPRLLSDLINIGLLNWRKLNNYNQSLLYLAASHRNVEAVKFLLNMGLDVNSVASSNSTPLHAAVLFGNENKMLETVRVLVENGANVSARNNLLETPLNRAAQGFNKNLTLQIVKYLIDHRESLL